MGPTGPFMYKFAVSIFRTSPILLAMIVRVLTFLNYSWKSRNYTFIVWESKVLAPCVLVSKLGMYLEKERFKPLHSIVVEKERFKPFHSTVVIFLIAFAFFLLTNKTSKNPCVSKVADSKKVGK